MWLMELIRIKLERISMTFYLEHLGTEKRKKIILLDQYNHLMIQFQICHNMKRRDQRFHIRSTCLKLDLILIPVVQTQTTTWNNLETGFSQDNLIGIKLKQRWLQIWAEITLFNYLTSRVNQLKKEFLSKMKFIMKMKIQEKMMMKIQMKIQKVMILRDDYYVGILNYIKQLF